MKASPAARPFACLGAVSGLALALSLLCASACGSQTCRIVPGICPVTSLAVVSGGSSAATGISGVQATLTGPVTATLSCQAFGSSTDCYWPSSVPLTSGTYSLAMSAPGYQALTSQVQLTVPPAVSCGCQTGAFQPATVSLVAVDGGVIDGGGAD